MNGTDGNKYLASVYKLQSGDIHVALNTSRKKSLPKHAKLQQQHTTKFCLTFPI